MQDEYALALEAARAGGPRSVVVRHLLRALKGDPDLAERARAEPLFAPVAEDRFLLEFLDPDSPLNDVIVDLMDGEVQDAIEALGAYLEDHPRSAPAWYMASTAHAMRDDDDAALAAADTAISLDAGFADARFNRATVLERLGRDEDAEVEYRRALELEPDHENVAFNLLLLLSRRGRAEEGVQIVRAVLREAPWADRLRYTQAETLAKLGQTGEALDELRALVARDPSARDAARENETFSALDDPDWREFLA